METQTGDQDIPSYVVGIGASAGGLEAIESFFKKMPSDTGLAFVVVQHLSPDYKSLMAELLSKHTAMPVNRIDEGVMIKPNNIYLIPPRKNLTVFHGRLLLNEQPPSGGLNLPIDIFMRSLAEDLSERAVGIVLSGTGSDGTRGIRAIKEHGGMVMVQDEHTAKFDGMPRNAIATGLVDFILPPDEMPRQLLDFVKHPFAVHEADSISSDDSDLTRVFAMLRDRHKIDFTHYKPNTVVRRIERRVTINQCRDLSEYRLLLEGNPQEVTTLYQELLIGVTSFFRDEAVFEEVRSKWLQRLLDTAIKDEIRLWVAGCSTGEEAYSIAMMLAEYREYSGQNFKVKIFATDVDQRAVEKASMGFYPESIAADVPSYLLAKYFIRRDDNFQVTQNIREMVVFAQHNLIKDPPFINIHLLSCRNLLIYLQPILQKKILELFNFSLIKDGLLVLGTSESIGEMNDYFELVHPKYKLYTSKGKFKPLGLSISDPLPTVANTFRPIMATAARTTGARNADDRVLDRFLSSLADDVLPFTMIVNEQLEITHIFGEAKNYLGYPSGKLVTDVTKLVIKDLAIPVATGIQKALKSGEDIVMSNIRVRDSDRVRTLTLQIRNLPGKKGQAVLVAIMIKEAEQVAAMNGIEVVPFDVDKDALQRINDLDQELMMTRESLQAAVEELETSNEELQATNEELLASNEELQSTNEELQSVNEELYTVNAEYQGKITELTLLNNDLDNLLNSTSIATLFLDENLEIRRFTPKLQGIFNIVDSDVGRPFFHLSHNLKNVQLEPLVQEVNVRHLPIERELLLTTGEWYFLRILPYAIAERVYAGVTVNFINIHQLKTAELDLQKQVKDELQRLAAFVNDSTDAITLQDARGKIVTWNRGAERLYGWTEAEALAMNFETIVPPEERERLPRLAQRLRAGETVPQFETQRITKGGQVVTVSAAASLLYPSQESGELLALTERDISTHLEVERKNCFGCMKRLAGMVMDADEAILLLDFKGNIVAWNKGAESLYGWSAAEAMGMNFVSLVPQEDRDEAGRIFQDFISGQSSYHGTGIRRRNKQDRIVHVNISASVLGDPVEDGMLVITRERLAPGGAIAADAPN